MGMTEEEAKRMLGNKYKPPRPRKSHAKQSRPAPARRPDEMNKTEAEYAKQLELQKQQGKILDWRFEPLTFRLAHRCTYTPDFLVVTPDEIQIHEVEGGFIREDAAVKWKTAAARHPRKTGKCPGYVERLNGANGHGDHEEPLALVGDQTKAKQIALTADGEDKVSHAFALVSELAKDTALELGQ